MRRTALTIIVIAIGLILAGMAVRLMAVSNESDEAFDERAVRSYIAANFPDADTEELVDSIRVICENTDQQFAVSYAVAESIRNDVGTRMTALIGEGCPERVASL